MIIDQKMITNVITIIVNLVLLDNAQRWEKPPSSRPPSFHPPRRAGSPLRGSPPGGQDDDGDGGEVPHLPLAVVHHGDHPGHPWLSWNTSRRRSMSEG